MTTPMEIKTATIMLTDTEQLVASFTNWHPSTDVYVDPQGDIGVVGALFFLYAVIDVPGGTPIRARVTAGIYDDDETLDTERVITFGTVGQKMELWAVQETPGVAPITPTKIAMVGWDTQAKTVNVTDSIALSDLTVPADGAWHDLLELTEWHPLVDLLVRSDGAVDLVGTEWQICANFPSFPGGIRPGAISDNIVTSPTQALERGDSGGAETWIVRARKAVGLSDVASCSAGLVGYSPAGT